MGWQYGSNHKLCATCAFWTGAREVTNSGSSVTNCEGYGKCAIPNGPMKNSDRMGTSSPCFDWQKWPVLK